MQPTNQNPYPISQQADHNSQTSTKLANCMIFIGVGLAGAYAVFYFLFSQLVQQSQQTIIHNSSLQVQQLIMQKH